MTYVRTTLGDKSIYYCNASLQGLPPSPSERAAKAEIKIRVQWAWLHILSKKEMKRTKRVPNRKKKKR